MSGSRSYRIGEVARQTGVSVETLRYYEKQRLLEAPPRTGGGFRLYSDDALQRVRFIRHARSLGLTLEDIRQLVVGLEAHGQAPACGRVRELLTRRIHDIEERVSELLALRGALRAHLAACERALSAAAEPPCPTLGAIDAAIPHGHLP